MRKTKTKTKELQKKIKVGFILYNVATIYSSCIL